MHRVHVVNAKQYRVGIDVGLNSVGLAAVEVNDDGVPVDVLCMESIIHDGGIDPTANKTAETRRAISGSARRMRRLVRHRRQRLADLDETLRSLGWPVVDLATLKNPRAPWQARIQLLRGKVQDEVTRDELLSIAVRHMARHRGWRNPYMSVNSLKQVTEPSSYFETLVNAIAPKLGKDASDLRDMTVAEIVALAEHLDIHEHIVEGKPDAKTGEVAYVTYFDVSRTLRGPSAPRRDGKTRAGLLESKIHQSDNVRELRRIWGMQGLKDDTFDLIVDKVFQAKSPKGSAARRVGKDPLDASQPRAEKASLAFQKYRILAILGNLRVLDHGAERPLDSRERRTIFEYLWTEGNDLTTWADVAGVIGVDRHALRGTAAETIDGERSSAHPPFDVTSARLGSVGVKELKDWWADASEPDCEAMIEVLGNGSGSEMVSVDHAERIASAEAFVGELPEESIAKLESIKLPEGRAAYSAKTLRRLTERMLASTDDAHEARKAVFGIDDKWRPPADPIGLPVGNPAVDRVLKIVNRFLLACVREWGVPQSVNIEHTRDGLMSERQARLQDRENNARFDRNREMAGKIAQYLAANRDQIRENADDSFVDDPGVALSGSQIGASRRDLDRWRAMERQESKCLYCGATLRWDTLEMDHIVPRAGEGATNTQVNLAAVCRDCNHSKGKLPFAVWAKSGVRPQVSLSEAIERVHGFRFFGVEDRGSDRDPRTYKARFRREVIDRLRRTDQDDPIDARSMESVGWMANELRQRVEAYFADTNDGTGCETRVGVFRGWITSEARKAAGIENRILLVGGAPGKNRLDRRHHAVDAATIAMIRQGAAQSLVVQRQAGFDLVQILAERDSMHRAYELTTDDYRMGDDDRKKLQPAWKTYKGLNVELFSAWQKQMEALASLVQRQLEADAVPVWEFLRLRPGSSQAHEAIIRSFTRDSSGDPLATACLGDQLSGDLIDRSATPQQWVALTRHPDFDKKNGLAADPSRRIRVVNRWLDATDELEFFPTGAGCVKVRGGYAELGASFHHSRIYRCAKKLMSGKVTTFYAMMRVYQIDLLGLRDQDVFSVEIPPQAISRRTAEDRLRLALDMGEAEYVGWIVPGDELRLDMNSQRSGQVAELLERYPDTNTWVVGGFFAPSQLRLYPRGLAAEGLPDDMTPGAATLMKSGWKPSVDPVFGQCDAQVIRRDILGRPRMESDAHFPVSWSARSSDMA